MSRSIAIVGNGSFAPSDASAIDKCDVVIRFNDCPSVGGGGLRTDVIAVCNTGRPAKAMIRQRSWREHPAILQASALWCVRDGARFAELEPLLTSQCPVLDDFCEDFTAEFASFAAETEKAFTAIPRLYHDRLDRELQALTSESYIVPSSGLMAITYVIGEVAAAEDMVMLAGFSHQGWNGHPFDAERELIESYVSRGKLRKLQPFGKRARQPNG